MFCRIPLYRPPRGRRCTRCKEVLPFLAFRPNLRLKGGWNSWCRSCCAEASRRWRREHPEHKLRRPHVPPSKLECVECGVVFEGPKNRLLCSRRCKDRRYARLHPEALRKKKQRYFRRQRERAELARLRNF